MNTIIIPTDFSSSADNALHFGAQLAQSINSPLHILHVYQIPVSISDIPVMTISGEELKKSADEGLERSKEELLRTYQHLQIDTESRLGDVTSELKDVCKEVNPLLVILGSHNESSIERMLFGSTALSVIRNLNCPVMVVSSEIKFAPIQQVVFATDLENISDTAAQNIIHIIQLLHAGLHIVHVNESKSNNHHLKQVEKLSQQFHEAQPQYHEINDADVAHGIQTYVQQNKADLIILIPHKHSLWERFFSKTHSESMLTQAFTPVLFLPEG